MSETQLLHGFFPDLFCRSNSGGSVEKSSKSVVGATISQIANSTRPVHKLVDKDCCTYGEISVFIRKLPCDSEP